MIEQIQIIPNEAEVFIEVTHQRLQGNGFIVVTHYSFPVNVKELKRLAGVYKPTILERIKQWIV